MERPQTRNSSREKVEEAIRHIQALHAQGESLIKQGRPYGVRDTASAKEKLAKAKAFANSVSGYTRRELKQLIVGCRKHQFPLTKAHIIRLVSVTKGPLRQELQDRILTERLSTVQLALAMRARFGNRRPSAGRARTMESWDDAKSIMLKFAEQWQRLHAAIRAKSENAKHTSGSSPFLPANPALKTKLKAVERAVSDLQRLLDPSHSKRSDDPDQR